MCHSIITKQQNSEMSDRAKLLLQSLEVMDNQESQLMNELSKVDDLLDEVNNLETTVKKLDQFTKHLQAQFHTVYGKR